MLYTNISDKVSLVSRNMIKTRVAPGENINLSPSDIRSSKSSMRFFESKVKREVVEQEKPFVIPEETVIPNQEYSQEPVVPEVITPEVVTPEVIESVVEEVVTEQPVVEEVVTPVVDEVITQKVTPDAEIEI
jgi:hypothetical protein